MATVILDVPSEKVSAFVKMIMDLGIEKNRIIPEIKNAVDSFSKKLWPAETRQHPYFDWDFYMNPLEFE